MTNNSTAAFSSRMVGRFIVRPNGERAYIVAALSTGRRVDGCSEYAAIWARRPYSTSEALESTYLPDSRLPFWTGYYTDGANSGRTWQDGRSWSAGEYGHSGLDIDTAMATIIRQTVGVDVAEALADAVTPIMVDVATSLATGKLVAELPELPA